MAGVLQGSPLADEHLFQELEFLVGEVDIAGRGEFDYPAQPSTFRFLSHSKTWCPGLTYLGIPVTGTISFWGRRGFNSLRKHGPNDGVSLLSDMIIPLSPAH